MSSMISEGISRSMETVELCSYFLVGWQRGLMNELLTSGYTGSSSTRSLIEGSCREIKLFTSFGRGMRIDFGTFRVL